MPLPPTIVIPVRPRSPMVSQPFGVVAPTTANIAPGGISSAESFGSDTVSASAGASPSTIGTGESFGTDSLSASAGISPTAIPTGEAFGSDVAGVSAGVQPTGIASGESFGSPVVTSGTATSGRWDDFNRTDLSAIGTPSDGGPAWVTSGGTWLISNPSGTDGRAYTNPGASQAVAYLEASTTDVDLQMSADVVGDTGLVARWVNSSNYFVMTYGGGTVKIFRQLSGTFTQLGLASVATAAGDVFKFKVQGSSLSAFKNGTQIIAPITDANHATSTKHGIRINNETITRIDDFSITDLNSGTAANIVPATIASGEAFGTDTVGASAGVSPGSIGSGETFGVPVASQSSSTSAKNAPILNGSHIQAFDAAGATLLHAYPFYEAGGTLIHDLVASGGINGTIVGAGSNWAVDPSGETVLRLSVGDVVNLLSSFSTNLTWSLAFRVKKDTIGGKGNVLCGSSQKGWLFLAGGYSGTSEETQITGLNLRTSTPPTGTGLIGIQPNLSASYDAQWNNWEMANDGTNLKVYINGSLVSTIAGANSALVQIDTIGGPANLGTFAGMIHHMHVYNGVLSSAQIASHAAGIDGLYASGSLVVSGAASGMTSTSVKLTATAIGGSPAYSYQWQTSPDNATWSNATGTGNASKVFTPTGLTAGGTTYFRPVVTDSASGIATGPSITVARPINWITITTPENPIQPYGTLRTGSIMVTVAGTYTGSPTVIEYSTDGSTWSVLGGTLGSGSFSGFVVLLDGWQGNVTLRFANSTGTIAAFESGVGHVHMIGGQSNAEGKLGGIQVYSHATKKCLVYRQNGGTNRVKGTGSWVDGIDPTDWNSQVGSLWPMLGTILMAETGFPQYFVTAALGGTWIDLWNKTNASTNCYGIAIAQAVASGVNVFESVIWLQGEADTGLSRSAYSTALNNLANNFAADLPGSPKLFPINTAQSGDGTRLATHDLMNTGKVGPGPTIYDLSNSTHPWTGSAVPDTLGKIVVGRLYFGLKESNFGGAAGSGRGPRLVSATSVPASTTVTVTFNRALKTGMTFNTTLWSVSDAGGAKTVSAVAYHPTDPNALNLTISTALASTPTVSYSLGMSTGGKVGPTSVDITPPGSVSGTIQLAAEAFSAAAITAPAMDVGIAVPGIATGESFGTVAAGASAGVSPPSVASGEAFGSDTTSVTAGVGVPTIATGESVQAPNLGAWTGSTVNPAWAYFSNRFMEIPMLMKNAPVAYFPIGKFVSTQDGSSVTTGSPVGTYSRDGASNVLSGAIAYNSAAGEWGITGLTADELNGDVIGLNFTLAGCFDIHVTVTTTTGINLDQKLGAPRVMDTVQDADVTLRDGLWGATIEAFGRWGPQSGLNTSRKTMQGTTVRTFLLDRAIYPASRS